MLDSCELEALIACDSAERGDGAATSVCRRALPPVNVNSGPALEHALELGGADVADVDGRELARRRRRRGGGGGGEERGEATRRHRPKQASQQRSLVCAERLPFWAAFMSS